MFRGNERMLSQFESVEFKPIYNHLEAYHIFGDPSTSIYTTRPQKFENIDIKNTGLKVVVKVEDFDIPVYISFYDKKANRIEKYKTDFGIAEFQNPSDSIIGVCIMAKNRIPYIKDVLPFNTSTSEPLEMTTITNAKWNILSETISVTTRFKETDLEVRNVYLKNITTGQTQIIGTVDKFNESIYKHLPNLAKGVYTLYLSGNCGIPYKIQIN